MATAKKAPAKKRAVTKKPTSKKVVSHATSRPVAKSPAKKSASKTTYRSFHVAKEEYPFLSLRVTKQTIIWAVLLIVIVILQLLILATQLEVVHVTTGLTTTF